MPKNQTDPESLELLAELEENTPDAVKQMRAHTRLSIRCKTVIQPANASERRSMKVQAVTGDLSSGGCQLLSPIPLLVGDLYQLTFDQETLPAPPVLAKCMRCRVVRDDAFESGFAFLSPLDIPAHLGSDADSNSLL